MSFVTNKSFFLSSARRQPMPNRRVPRAAADLPADQPVLHLHMPAADRRGLLPHVAQDAGQLLARNAPHSPVRQRCLLLGDSAAAVRAHLLDVHGRSGAAARGLPPRIRRSGAEDVARVQAVLRALRQEPQDHERDADEATGLGDARRHRVFVPLGAASAR